jgi:hypothetical protein
MKHYAITTCDKKKMGSKDEPMFTVPLQEVFPFKNFLHWSTEKLLSHEILYIKMFHKKVADMNDN